MNSNKIISRLAPTPSGFLHVGNAINFLITWMITRKKKGTLHLRIDDIDSARMRPEYVEDTFRAIEWLGIDYDKGPAGVDDFLNNYSQQKKIDQYHDRVKDLEETFACSCSRAQIKKNSPSGIYPGTCRDKEISLEKGESALRIKIPEDTSYSIGKHNVQLDKCLGDFVIWRKDGLPAYQLVSVLDDIDIGTNLIIRGDDLLESSIAQHFLAEQLNEKSYCDIVYFHHDLIKDDDSQKLSKSKGHNSLKYHYEKNESPEFVFEILMKFLGINKKISKAEELLTLEYNPDLYQIL